MRTETLADGVVLRLGDCREILLDTAKHDLVLTDPPYGIGADRNLRANKRHGKAAVASTDYGHHDWDSSAPSADTLRLVVDSGKNAVLWGGNYFGLEPSSCWLVWDKENVGLGRVWRNQHELVIAARWETSEFQEDGKLRSDVMRYRATLSAQREHPVEKPTSLLVSLIQPTTPKSGIVLDPFAGSGTTLLAARMLGIRSIGIEIEERYCASIAKRLQQQAFSFEAPASCDTTDKGIPSYQESLLLEA